MTLRPILRPRATAALACLAVVVSLLLGCSGETPAACQSPTDCPSPLTCSNGVCVQDAPIDAGADAATDAGSPADATIDATVDAATDAAGSADATADGEASTDAPIDAATDASGDGAPTGPDTTAPSFGGAASVTNATATSLTVTWAAAADDVTPAASIVYDVCYGTSPTACTTGFVANVTTGPGATAFTANGLAPSTAYTFVVRARDAAGNRDANTAARTGTTTADTTAPSFGGAASVTNATGTSLTVTWTPATDDTTPASSITYEVCYAASTACATNFTATRVVSGVTSFVATGLQPSTAYTFVVRARDAAGNRDGNAIARSGSTLGDATPPTFTGSLSVTNPTPTSLTVTWPSATDDVTPASAIAYEICYAASTACTTNFTASRTVTGSTSTTVTGLSPSTTYTFAVRALDAAGNRATTTIVGTGATTADTAPPTLSGSLSVTNATATALTVAWPAATDNVTPASSIVYEICYGASVACTTNFTVTRTVTGATSTTVTGLSPTTTYTFVIRAVDAAGNRTVTTIVGTGATTADTTAPTFAGAASVTNATTGSLTVTWTPASDDVTPAGSIVYDVCYAASATACVTNFVASVTATGTTSATATNLQPSTAYTFVVRARDAAGNRDANTIARSGSTLGDTIAPTFTSATATATRTGCGTGTLTWPAATDNVTPGSALRYAVCQSTTSGTCTSVFTESASVVGATSYTFTGVTTAPTVYFVVRAEDAAGNRSALTTEVALNMSDGVAPTWGTSATTANANCGTSTSASVTLAWPVATDSCSAGAIRYRVCRVQGRGAGECTSTWFTDYTTANNTASLNVSSGLSPATGYLFYVRAEDGYGNLEAGSHGPLAVTTKVSYAASVQPTLSTNMGNPGGCAGCHAFTHASIVNASSNYAGFKIIAPFSTATSSLYQKVMNTGLCGGVMPSSPFTVPATWKTNVTTWINEGACNN